MMKKINSEAWKEFDESVREILCSVPLVTYKGEPITDSDSQFKEAVSKLIVLPLSIQDTEITLFNESTATLLVYDELYCREENQQSESDEMLMSDLENYKLGGKYA